MNAEIKRYGIEFPIKEAQFRKAVHILDLCTYLDENNMIQYKGYAKPTDSKRYLNPNSFHPRSTFNAIPFSQFLRTLRNNSKTDTAASELELCVNHFENSGYDKIKLLKLKQKAVDIINEPSVEQDVKETLVFPLHYFKGVEDLKQVVRSLENELQSLIGDVRIMFAMK